MDAIFFWLTEQERSLVFSVVVGRTVPLVSKGDNTTTMNERLQDLRMIWVLALAKRSRPLCIKQQRLKPARGHTLHPQTSGHR